MITIGPLRKGGDRLSFLLLIQAEPLSQKVF